LALIHGIVSEINLVWISASTAYTDWGLQGLTSINPRNSQDIPLQLSLRC